jgi:1,4-dihydroxy-2-naphthoate octaprenyltransferase
MPPREPQPGAPGHPLARAVLATRPAFLSVTLVGCLVGFASAAGDGVAFLAGPAVLAVLAVLCAHAGVNVLNDYYDHLNGTDARNTGRVFPFTGGSRMIQNGVMTPRETIVLGCALFAVTAIAGLVFLAPMRPALLAIGAAGLLIGWGYSAPPLAFASRGMGEPAVAAGFLLVVVGADVVQRGAPAWAPVVAGLGYALLVANVLFINQFPDREADGAAGKRTWVVRLGAQRACVGYPVIAGLAFAWVAVAAAAGLLPARALWSLAAAPLAWRATIGLRAWVRGAAELAPAIRATIGAALLHGLIISLTLASPRWFTA